MLKILFASVAIAGLSMLAPAAVAQAKLDPLGSVVHDAKPIRSVIDVPRRPGGYVGLRMDIERSEVEILDLKVVYGNGVAEDFKVKQVFKPGTSSRIIDIKGGSRQLQQIIVTYVAKGPARISFLGVPGKQQSFDWEPLGCKDVSFGIDRDVVKVGRKDGSFKSIRLNVKQAPIDIFDLRVVFGNGQRQDIRVRTTIKPNEDTRPIDLAGETRGIDRVEMIYKSVPNFKGKATVCVQGLQR